MERSTSSGTLPAAPPRVQPRRVAMLTETTGPGGLETVLVTLAAGLRERGHEVVPVFPEAPVDWLMDTLTDRGFRSETFRLRRGWRGLVAAARDISAILWRRRIESLHTHDFSAAILGGAAAAPLRIPTVMTLHGNPHYSERWYRRALLGWAARRSRAVVTVSEALKERVARDLRLPSGGVQVVPNGVSPFSGHRNRGRAVLGGAGGTVVLAVGRLEDVKGFDILLGAVARLKEGVPPFRVYVAGEGSRRGELEALRDALGLEGRVTFLGMRSDIPDLLAGADLFVLPSRSEGMPVALIEAMASGLPAVASRVGGIPEVMDEGVEGLLVEAEDPVSLSRALATLLPDAALRKRMGLAARARVTGGLTAGRMLDRYEYLLCGVP